MRKLLRQTITVTNLVIAAILLLSVLSRYINPARFWLPAFLGLAYPYFLAANVLFMVFWLARWRREFFISFLAILLGWNTLSGYFSLHPVAALKMNSVESAAAVRHVEDRQLKVMSFNVRGFDRYRWAGDPSIRRGILQAIREEEADIVCIQEFYTTRLGSLSPSEVYRELSFTPHRHLEYTAGGISGRYGIATFCAHPIVHSGSIRFANTINISIFTDIRVGEDTIRVYNNHLQSIYFNRANYRFLDSLKFRYDNQQMEEIRDISVRLRDAFVKRAEQAEAIAFHMAGCPYRMIVCGDFNDTPVSYAYYRISRGMQDAFIRTGMGAGRTYIGRFPSFRIDFILYSGGLEALYFNRKKVRLSDHLPVIAYLQLI